MYLMIAGFPPFYGANKNAILKLIISGKVEYTGKTPYFYMNRPYMGNGFFRSKINAEKNVYTGSKITYFGKWSFKRALDYNAFEQ